MKIWTNSRICSAQRCFNREAEMRDTDYAYCVARIRANERYLLNSKDIWDLFECKDFESALQLLIDKKWINQKGEISDCIKYQSDRLSTLLSECIPYKKDLENTRSFYSYFVLRYRIILRRCLSSRLCLRQRTSFN